MRYLLIAFLLIQITGCDENNSNSNINTATEQQVKDNSDMINMMKQDIEDMQSMLEMTKDQVQSLENQVEGIDNQTPPPPVLVPVPTPVPVPVPNSSTMPEIIDKNGTVLGEVIGPYSGNTSFSTILELNNIDYVVLVSSFGIQGAFNGVVFANNDCTGQAYLDKGSTDITMVIPTSVAPADATMDPNNETLYEADLNNQVNATFNSIWNIPDKTCDAVTDTRDLYIANPVFDLSTLFEPPYTVQ